jgi:hypothetical protein
MPIDYTVTLVAFFKGRESNMGYASMHMAAALLAGTTQQPAFELNEVHNTLRVSNQAPVPSPERPDGPMIAGLGELIFAPDPIDFPLASYEQFKMSNEYGLYSTVELGIRRDGYVSTCIQFTYGYGRTEKSNDALSKHLCSVIKQKARYQFTNGVTLPDAPGYLVLSITWAKQFTPKSPVQFGAHDKGFATYFYVDPVAKSSSEPCSLYASELTDEAQQKICTALLASPAFRNRRAQFMRKRRGQGSFTVSAWVLPDKSATAQSLVKWSETNYDQSPPAFVDTTIYSHNGLDKADSGQFFWTLNASDRPDAKLDRWQRYLGVAVLRVTVNPDGSVKDCRPFQYSDAAVMDFKACDSAKKTGRFVITNGEKVDQPFDILVDVKWPLE